MVTFLINSLIKFLYIHFLLYISFLLRISVFFVPVHLFSPYILFFPGSMWYIWLDGTLPLFLASQTGLHFVEKYYPLVPKATVSSLDGSIFLCFPGKALVGMAEVEAAIQEMFQAPQIQVS